MPVKMHGFLVPHCSFCNCFTEIVRNLNGMNVFIQLLHVIRIRSVTCRKCIRQKEKPWAPLMKKF